MKFTTSKDGQLRTDLRLSHRVGWHHLVMAATLTYAEIRQEDDDEGPDARPRSDQWWRKAVEVRLRQELWEHGEVSIVGWADHVEDDAVRAGQGLVARLWPGLVPAELKGQHL